MSSEAGSHSSSGGVLSDLVSDTKSDLGLNSSSHAASADGSR